MRACESDQAEVLEVLDLSRLDPRAFERAGQMLLRRLYPDLVSIDGSGGDGGRDAERPLTGWRSGDGLEVFEIKSHTGRLVSSTKRQIKQSLKRAVECMPQMRKWNLVIGINPTPGELSWFRSTLVEVAGGEVELTWRGLDWLDGQFAEHTDIRRYIEGPQSELLRAASEHHLEQTILAGGLQDLARRHMALQGRVDEQSPYWTLDASTSASGLSFSLRAKHPDAATLDPITVRPRFDFSAGDEETQRAFEQFEATVSYGGITEIEPAHFKGLEIEASEEVLRMLGDTNQPARLRLGSEPRRLERPFRATLEARDGGPTGRVVVSVEVSFIEHTFGLRGGRMFGSDAAGTMKVQIELPRPADGQEEGTISGGEFSITFGSAWDFPVGDVLSSLKLQAALACGAHLNIRSSWARMFVQQVNADGGEATRLTMLARAAEVLAGFEGRLGVRLRLPTAFNGTEVQVAEYLLRALDGERVLMPGMNITADLEPGAVREILSQLGDGAVEFLCVERTYIAQIGDVEIPYGVYGIRMSNGVVANREELLAGPDDGSVPMILQPASGSLVLLNRAEAEAECERADAASIDGAGLE